MEQGKKLIRSISRKNLYADRRSSSNRTTVGNALRALCDRDVLDQGKVVEILCLYIDAKRGKQRSEVDILRRLENIQVTVPRSLLPSFQKAKVISNLSEQPSRSLRLRTNSPTTASSCSTPTSVSSRYTGNLLSPSSSTRESPEHDIFSPRSFGPGRRTRGVIPVFDCHVKGERMEMVWPFSPRSIDTTFFPPVSFDSISGLPKYQSKLKEVDVGKSNESVDQIVLDSFPLPPAHLPHITPPRSTRMTPIGKDAEVDGSNVSPWSPLASMFDGWSDDEDDSRTITAVTPISSEEWSEDIHEEEDVFGNGGVSKSDRIRYENLMDKSARWVDRAHWQLGIAV